MFHFMYASSRTRHDVYLSCMSLCIIMLELFIRSPCFLARSFRSFGFVTVFSSHVWMLPIAVTLIGKINSRMTRGGSNTQACEDVLVRHSARQVGHSPEPYPHPPPPPSNPASTKQIMRMFEERRNNDLIELLKSVQAMIGQNGNQNGHHSKL